MKNTDKLFRKFVALILSALLICSTLNIAAFAADTNSALTAASGDDLQNDLVAKYEFNETSGTIAADSSGNGKNATLTSAAFAAGKTGNALSLSGSSQYASLASGIVSGCNDLTVAAWVKLDTISSWSRIFDFGTGTTSYMFLTPSSSANKIRFAISNGGSGSEQQIDGNAALETGSWKHVAVTLAGDTGILYIDGAAVGTNNGMSLNPSDLGVTNQNYIGKSQYSDPYLDGLVDDFVIYNRALSKTEIAGLAGTTPVNSAPVVDAGSDNTSVILPAAINLNGTATDDELPEGSAITTVWTLLSGPAPATFGNADSLATTATVTVPGTYVFKLTASDGALTASDTVTVTVHEQGTPAAENIAPNATATSDYVASGYSLSAINDGYEPTSSTDTSHGAYCNLSTPAAPHWVQYDFDKYYTINACEIYWLANGRTLLAPSGFSYQYWNGTEWVPVHSPSAYELVTNKYSRTDFMPVTTNRIKVLIQNLSTSSTGIIEWKVYTGGVTKDYAPEVEAGPMTYVTMPSTIQLKGSVVDDNPNSAITSTWSFVSGNGQASISDVNSLNTTVTVTKPGPYVFKLAVSDGVNTSADHAIINVYKQGSTNYTNIMPLSNITASNTAAGYTTGAIKDGYTPLSSSDTSHGAYANSGATQTVDIEFTQAYLINQADIYWFDNGSTIRTPASYKLYYWNGKEFIRAYNQEGLGTAGNQFNTSTFTPVFTHKIRLETVAQSGKGMGIIEMKLLGCRPSALAANLSDQGDASANSVASGSSLNALWDSKAPSSSSDTSSGVYKSNAGSTTQWVQYDFNSTMTIEEVDLYWYADSSVSIPSAYTVKYWNGSGFVAVANVGGYGRNSNQYNTTVFTPVDTTKIRVEMTPDNGKAVGILEWKVFGNPKVSAPPAWVNSFYSKCITVFNVPIVASAKVNDQALINAAYTINAELRKIAKNKPAILQKLISNRSKVCIVSFYEYNYQHPGQEGTDKTLRAAYAGQSAFTLEEENIIPPDKTRFFVFNVLCHEFAHTILSHGIGEANGLGADDALFNRIRNAYNNAIANNLYTESSYDRSNYHEFWTGQVCRWFNSNPTDLNVPNANKLSHREQLRLYDPTTYSIVEEVFGDYKLSVPWID